MVSQSSPEFKEAVEDNSGSTLYEKLTSIYVEKLEGPEGMQRYSLTSYEPGALDGILSPIHDYFVRDVLSRAGTPQGHVGEQKPAVRVFDVFDRDYIGECLCPVKFAEVERVLDALDQRAGANTNLLECVSPFQPYDTDGDKAEFVA